MASQRAWRPFAGWVAAWTVGLCPAAGGLTAGETGSTDGAADAVSTVPARGDKSRGASVGPQPTAHDEEMPTTNTDNTERKSRLRGCFKTPSWLRPAGAALRPSKRVLKQPLREHHRSRRMRQRVRLGGLDSRRSEFFNRLFARVWPRKRRGRIDNDRLGDQVPRMPSPKNRPTGDAASVGRIPSSTVYGEVI